MKISTKGRYAVEIMADLALYSEEGRLESLRSIAHRRGLSEKYLERIVGALKKNELLMSVRGVHGGYSLAKRPEDISVRSILVAVEGELAPVECLTEEPDCGMDCSKCPTRSTWDLMWHNILGIVDEVTLTDIINNIK